MDEGIAKTGEKLDVSARDVKEIRGSRRIETLYKIVGGILVISSGILGATAGQAYYNSHSPYPYSNFLPSGVLGLSSRGNKTILKILLITGVLSLLSYFAGYAMGSRNFGMTIMYNVHKR